MHILLITDSYPPEIRSASHLMLELAEELHQRGHRVSVLTSWPQYNLTEDSPDVAERVDEDGIDVIRVKSLPHHKVNYILRGIAQLWMPVKFGLTLRRYGLHRVDTVLVYSPPLPLALLGVWLKQKGARFVLNVQDIFPQNAIDLNILRNYFLIKLFQALERHCYRWADCVTAHSEGNRRLLAKNHPEIEHKLVTLHNWVDVDHHKIVHSLDFRAQYNLQNKFVALFAGVIGPAQGLDVLIEIASRVRDLPDLLFLFVGDGKEKESLEAKSKSLGLDNVMFKPFVTREQYPALLRAVDIGLVVLSAKNKTPVVPGKLLGYMAASLPVFALLNRESDGHELMAEAECGYAVNSDDIDEAEKQVRQAYQNREHLHILGEHGCAYALQHFTKQSCVSRIESLLQGAVA